MTEAKVWWFLTGVLILATFAESKNNTDDVVQLSKFLDPPSKVLQSVKIEDRVQKDRPFLNESHIGIVPTSSPTKSPLLDLSDFPKFDDFHPPINWTAIESILKNTNAQNRTRYYNFNYYNKDKKIPVPDDISLLPKIVLPTEIKPWHNLAQSDFKVPDYKIKTEYVSFTRLGEFGALIGGTALSCLVCCKRCSKKSSDKEDSPLTEEENGDVCRDDVIVMIPSTEENQGRRPNGENVV